MNDRELAAILWLTVLVVWGLSQRDIRHHVRPLLSAVVHPLVAVPFVLMTAWIAGVVVGVGALGGWDVALLGGTITWFLSAGIGLFGKAVNVFSQSGGFKSLVLAALSLTVLVEGFVNLYVFPLPVEIVLLPFAAFLGMLSVVAGTEDRFSAVKKLVVWYIAYARRPRGERSPGGSALRSVATP